MQKEQTAMLVKNILKRIIIFNVLFLAKKIKIVLYYVFKSDHDLCWLMVNMSSLELLLDFETKINFMIKEEGGLHKSPSILTK